MSLDEFKLSSVLYGHSLDVRGVATNDENCIISGSRDKTCKYWRPNTFNAGYTEGITLKGHKNYVSCVCWLRPSQEFPNGHIISGGNDSNICVYSLDTPDAICTIEGHSNTVCSVRNGIHPNTFVTSSWDCTAKLWTLAINTTSSSLTISKLNHFVGHMAAVWAAIQLPNGNFATGSADKEIFIWSETAQKLKVLKGHTDCVRDLAVLSKTMFVSVANDATIRQWTLDGECIQTLYGHTNYIYSVCANPILGENSFVTAGEDRQVKVWQNGENTQSLILPAQSVWSVTCLSNGDIITGSSDALVRVFTKDPERVADDQQLKLFEEEVASLTVASAQEIGGVKISDLPGREVLYEPGKTDGQTKLIREGAGVMCYSWSAAEGTWNKVGDVMGAAGGTQASSGKTLYEGKEYDFVFSVDIEDGKPPLKLPYNRDQDPWKAAQEFIHKNDLSQMFLEQVANFIVQNSGVTVIQQQSSDYVDPFTGGSRYLPGTDTRTPGGTNSGMNLDPFTGGNSYTTATSTSIPPPIPPTTQPTHNAVPTSPNHPQISPYFPHFSYLFFDQGNVAVIHEKLKEFNKKTDACNVDEEILDGVVKLATSAEIEGPFVPVLVKLLEWPYDMVFPVLDITRLALRHKENNHLLCTHTNGELLVKLLRKYLVENVAANKMLALRIMCNMFSFPTGEKLIVTNEPQFLTDISTFGADLNKNSQIALSTFLLNLSIALMKAQNCERLSHVIEVIAKCLLNLNDLEAEFRGYVALGTIFSSFKVPGTSQSSHLPQIREKLVVVSRESSNDATKLRNISCAQQLLMVF